MRKMMNRGVLIEMKAGVIDRELVDATYNLAEAVAAWEAANPEPEDPRRQTVICCVEGKYVPFNRTVLPASITEILMYWPCGVELCGRLNAGGTL